VNELAEIRVFVILFNSLEFFAKDGNVYYLKLIRLLQVKPSGPAAFGAVSTYHIALSLLGGHGPFSLCVLVYKEVVYTINRDIG
jgi:hypothetical protein